MRTAQFIWLQRQQNGREILPPAYGSDPGIIKSVPKPLINWAAGYLWLAQEFVYVGDKGVVEPGSRMRRMGIELELKLRAG